MVASKAINTNTREGIDEVLAGGAIVARVGCAVIIIQFTKITTKARIAETPGKLIDIEISCFYILFQHMSP